MLRRIMAVLWASPLLLGCELYDEALLPSLTGEFPTGARRLQLQPDTLVLGDRDLDAPGHGMTLLMPQAAAMLPLTDFSGRAGASTPLAVIRFADPNVAFEGPLHAAIRRALAGKPDAGIGLVAVSPAGLVETLDEAVLQRNIERVLAALDKAGIAEDRVMFTAASDSSAKIDEVRVYVLDLSEAP